MNIINDDNDYCYYINVKYHDAVSYVEFVAAEAIAEVNRPGAAVQAVDHALLVDAGAAGEILMMHSIQSQHAQISQS
eukprot:COSAG06_NODE_32559_length_503_cov_675.225248_1_plen_76_part_10